MMNQVTRMISRADSPYQMARGAESDSLLVDSAISHAEKLRRILELEAWINTTTPDNPLPATTSRAWQEEREQLLAELRLEDGAANSPELNTAPSARRARTSWLQRLLRRLRPDQDADFTGP